MNSGKVNTAAITGIGILSPIGNSKEEVLNSLRTFKDGIGEASKIDVSSFLSHKNAEVKNVNFSEKLTQKELEDFTDPYLRMALVAAKDALHSAKVDVGDKVIQWQEIGGIGTTGYSTGNHLHFQVKNNGRNVDGMSLIDFNNTKNDSIIPPYFEPQNPIYGGNTNPVSPYN